MEKYEISKSKRAPLPSFGGSYHQYCCAEMWTTAGWRLFSISGCRLAFLVCLRVVTKNVLFTSLTHKGSKRSFAIFISNKYTHCDLVFRNEFPVLICVQLGHASRLLWWTTLRHLMQKTHSSAMTWRFWEKIVCESKTFKTIKKSAKPERFW